MSETLSELNFTCPRCNIQTPVPKVDGQHAKPEEITCGNCGYNMLEERRRREKAQKHLDEIYKSSHNPKTHWKPGKRDRVRCLEIIRGIVRKNVPWITSWDDFSEVREQGLIPDEWSNGMVLRAIQAGIREGWFEADWGGVGLTPWSGSARRQRNYCLTEKGREYKGD